MRIINRDELKAKMERGDNFKLIMTLDRRAFDHAHIPGSLHFDNMTEAMASLDPDDEIVVYCSHPACHSSVVAYLMLRSRGFRNISRYAGGLSDWSSAGFPLEGRMIFPENIAQAIPAIG